MTSIKNAKLIKQHYPDSKITVAFLNLRAAGKYYEEYYLEARKLGVNFIKGTTPRVFEDPVTKTLKVHIGDMLDDCMEMKEYEFDLIVLSSAMQPANDIKKLNEVLKLETSPDGFYKEFHARLNPIDTSVKGISLAGSSQGPKSISETIAQSRGAASSAGILMKPGQYTMVMLKAVVEKDRCSKCGLCEMNCPYYAIQVTSEGAEVNEVQCRGCGICVKSCPSQSISVRNARDEQFNALIDNLLFRA